MGPPPRRHRPPIGAAGWYAATALAARGALALLGAGGPLLWRPEVSTPLNSLLGVREGLRLLRLGLSPYAGAMVHAPPLVLTLHAATAVGPALYVLPNVAADATAALAIWRLASLLCRGRSAEDAGARGPGWFSLARACRGRRRPPCLLPRPPLCPPPSFPASPAAPPDGPTHPPTPAACARPP
jgi:hypothetical protein